MALRIIMLWLLLCTISESNTLLASDKHRLIVLTDIENEPDDAMSLVRFLCYSNQWDVEGLVATTSVHQQNKTAAWRIKEILQAYGQVRDNLEKHEPGFPSAAYLMSVVREGRADYGMRAVGKGMDSPGSDLIIQTVDRPDSRPVWVLAWGGPNCLAQALWKVKDTRSQKELEHFVSKLRVYTISDQDDSGPWIRKTFPDLFYIASPGFHRYGGYHYATWSGISGDYFHARCPGGDFSLVDNNWVDNNIQNKGPLGQQYPDIKFLMEGDSPSFMFLIDNGLGDPEHPDWGSWGGRYEYYLPKFEKWFLEPETRPLWTNAMDEVLGSDGRWHTSNHATIWRWREHFQNDFSARMDWTIKTYEQANHPPVPKLGHESYLRVQAGERVNLSAAGSSDPDADSLSYKWFLYGEPGTFAMSTARTGSPLKINDSDKQEAWFIAPENVRMGTMHIVLAVSDKASPSLTRYKRVIVEVQQSKPRILVSTDIGGTDPDDNQSMIHLLMYSNEFQLEGLISSPSYGEGSKEEISTMIALYEKDLPQLQKQLQGYPDPDYLRSISKQGRRGAAPYKGYTTATEGSDWIVQSAGANNEQPLWILIWGGLDDLAQALHDAPDIQSRIRIYWIGGPNKKWSANSYAYIASHFPDLWFIEANASYRGFFSDKDSRADLKNEQYFSRYIAGRGKLGAAFENYYRGSIKMGDTPSLLYLLKGNPDLPETDHWGGSFEKMKHSPCVVLEHPLSLKDTVPVYSIVEIRFKGPELDIERDSGCFILSITNQELIGYYLGDGMYSVRCCPKQAQKLSYLVSSDIEALSGLRGEFIVDNKWPGAVKQSSYTLGNNWYTDCTDPALFEGSWQGARTVSRWRQEVLLDWVERWDF